MSRVENESSQRSGCHQALFLCNNINKYYTKYLHRVPPLFIAPYLRLQPVLRNLRLSRDNHRRKIPVSSAAGPHCTAREKSPGYITRRGWHIHDEASIITSHYKTDSAIIHCKIDCTRPLMNAATPNGGIYSRSRLTSGCSTIWGTHKRDRTTADE